VKIGNRRRESEVNLNHLLQESFLADWYRQKDPRPQDHPKDTIKEPYPDPRWKRDHIPPSEKVI